MLSRRGIGSYGHAMAVGSIDHERAHSDGPGELFGGMAQSRKPLNKLGYVRVAVERAIGGARNASTASYVSATKISTSGNAHTESLGLDHGLTYSWHDPKLAIVGERVLVPLGRGNISAPGIVVEVGGGELLGGIAPERVKPITKRVGVALPVELVELARWLAKRCYCSLGTALATMMPAAVKKGTGKKRVEMVTRVANAALPGAMAKDVTKDVTIKVVQVAPVIKLSPTARKAWAAAIAVGEAEFPMPMKQLARMVGVKSLVPIRGLVAAGLLAVHVEEHVSSSIAILPEDEDNEDDDEVHEAGESLERTTTPLRDTPPALTDEQQCAVDAVDLSKHGEFLLFGVTGSGKTEVYLTLIERVLSAGKDAIVLVPEIALTPQTQRRFIARFGRDRVAVLHSGLTSAQRHAEWTRCFGRDAGTQANQAGGAYARGMVVVGARSAVFAPLPNLGFIVIDEEHDSSYKQDQSPRYLALDVARERARRSQGGAGSPLLLGSATPGLERWARATMTPRAKLLTLTRRATGAPLPTVRVVDLAEERRIRVRMNPDDPHVASRVHVLGPTLENAMETTLSAGGQVILLLNRRGFAHYVACPSPTCGFIVGCDACDARLVLHKGNDLPAGSVVRCHHCLAEAIVPGSCPLCHKRLRVWGAGTQRAEEELTRKFASFGLIEGDTLLRLDADTMRRAADYFAALDRFASGKARVLLGTQMIAKGLDFPGVRLVGVLDADTSMSLPDFRASERTYQLVSQVAGRAGRVGAAGVVIVQTWCPDSPAIKAAAMHDYRGFAKGELAIRKRAGLPPFSRMARILTRDESERSARELGERAAIALREVATARGLSVRVRGPVPCTISRIADRFRFCVEVVAKNLPELEEVLDGAWNAGALSNNEAMAIDVDPTSLM